MPSDAYSVDRSRELRSHRKEAVVEVCSTQRKDQGNGTFREVESCRTKYKEIPVHDDRCTYRSKRVRLCTGLPEVCSRTTWKDAARSISRRPHTRTASIEFPCRLPIARL